MLLHIPHSNAIGSRYSPSLKARKQGCVYESFFRRIVHLEVLFHKKSSTQKSAHFPHRSKLSRICDSYTYVSSRGQDEAPPAQRGLQLPLYVTLVLLTSMYSVYRLVQLTLVKKIYEWSKSTSGKSREISFSKVFPRFAIAVASLLIVSKFVVVTGFAIDSNFLSRHLFSYRFCIFFYCQTIVLTAFVLYLCEP